MDILNSTKLGYGHYASILVINAAQSAVGKLEGEYGQDVAGGPPYIVKRCVWIWVGANIITQLDRHCRFPEMAPDKIEPRPACDIASVKPVKPCFAPHALVDPGRIIVIIREII